MTSALEPHAEVVIADAVRSPLGWLGTRGTVGHIAPATLLAQTASGLLDRIHLEPAAVTRVAVVGGSRFEEVARRAALQVGVPAEAITPSTTASSTAFSSGSWLHAATRLVGPRDVVLVLGTSGSQPRAHQPSVRRLLDAERVAMRWDLRRGELDHYAELTRARAREVAAMGEFGPEIVPAVAWSQQSCTVVTGDETVEREHAAAARPGAPTSSTPPEMRDRPLVGWHHHDGTISQPAVGAAATILVGHDRAIELGIRPRARVLALAEGREAPETSAAGLVQSSQEVLRHSGVRLNDLDHYEVGESFAALPLAWRRELGVDLDRFNPRGGSIGLGSLGPADGLRSLATMLSALHATGGRLGLLTSAGASNAGEACLVEYLHRPCCSRDVLGARFSRDSNAGEPSFSAPAP